MPYTCHDTLSRGERAQAASRAPARGTQEQQGTRKGCPYHTTASPGRRSMVGAGLAPALEASYSCIIETGMGSCTVLPLLPFVPAAGGVGKLLSTIVPPSI